MTGGERYCHKCGTKARLGASYCAKCGGWVDEEMPEPLAPPEPQMRTVTRVYSRWDQRDADMRNMTAHGWPVVGQDQQPGGQLRVTYGTTAPAGQALLPSEVVLPAKKSPLRIPALIGVGIVLVCLAVQMIGAMGKTSSASSSAPFSSTSSVVYTVTGTEGVTMASLTYENAQGGSEQQDVALPWTYSMTAKRGQFLYISAQNDTRYPGGISCEITSNGTSFKRSSSHGVATIATCNGSAP